jgi:hypothetical protein
MLFQARWPVEPQKSETPPVFKQAGALEICWKAAVGTTTIPIPDTLGRAGFTITARSKQMFDAAMAFDRYRLEVVRRWPDGHEKEAVLAAIRSSLVSKNPGKESQKVGTQWDSSSTGHATGQALRYE